MATLISLTSSVLIGQRNTVVQVWQLLHKNYHNSTLQWQNQSSYLHFHYASANHWLCHCLTSLMPSVLEVTQRSIASWGSWPRRIIRAAISLLPSTELGLLVTAWRAEGWDGYRGLGKDIARGSKASTQSTNKNLLSTSLCLSPCWVS